MRLDMWIKNVRLIRFALIINRLEERLYYSVLETLTEDGYKKLMCQKYL